MQTYDQKPRQRLWEVMKSQGMQENQQVVFMSDGGEDVRQVREYLHPNGEHLLDWFHITMRLTVLQQQVKTLQAERPDEGSASSKQIVSIMWRLATSAALLAPAATRTPIGRPTKRGSARFAGSIPPAERSSHFRNSLSSQTAMTAW